MTSNTTGTHNALYDDLIPAATYKVYSDVCKELGQDIPLLKDSQTKDMKNFMASEIYSKSFAGLSQEQSDKIKGMLLNGISQGRKPDNMIKSIIRITGKDFPLKNAEGILWGEYHAITNKAREWAFRQSDPKGEKLYRWLGPQQPGRTTTVCTNIKTRTAKGVTLDRLKEIIREESEKGKVRGEVDKSFEGREFQGHFGCRHTYVRHFRK